MPIGIEAYPWSVLPDSHWEALYGANGELIDDVLDDLARLNRGVPFPELAIAEYLPPRHLLRYDQPFLRKFLACLMSVGLKLRLPGFHPLACTAEELAVYAMKLRAEELLEERDEEGDFTPWEDIALDDADHELLFAPAYDGIEDAPQAQAMAVVHLPYDEWFLPFNPSRAVHLYAQDTAREEPPWVTDRALYPPDDGGGDANCDQDGPAGTG